MIARVYAGALRGELAVPASKSAAHRAAICAALCKEETFLAFRGGNDDITATLRVLRAMGCGHEQRENGVRMRPNGAPLGDTADCGESGSTLRFMLPLAGALGKTLTFTGRGRLPQRNIAPLLEALCRHGCTADGERLPLTLSGGLKSGVYTLPGNVSSQFVTGLLLALPLPLGDSEIRLTTPLESAGYVEMTRRMQERFGVRSMQMETGWRIPGGQEYVSPGELAVEGDWSGASFWLAANALGSEIGLEGLDAHSAQPDAGVLQALQRILREDSPQIDVSGMPDSFPVLTVAAALQKEKTVRFVGGARLRDKESDRITAMAENLRKLGVSLAEAEDGLQICGQERLRGGVRLSGFGDHRVVMALAIAALGCENWVEITNAEAAGKSYPAFFEDFARLGGKCDVV